MKDAEQISDPDARLAEAGDGADAGADAPLARGGRGALVHDTLQREILTLELRPGAPLDETQLSQRFGMSRSPIREALNRLAAQNLVVMLPNRSTQVAPLELADFPRYVEALGFAHRINTRLAAQRRSAADVEEIRRRAREFDESLAPYDNMEMSARNKAFHMAIARAGGNRYLLSHYGALLDEGRRILHLQFDHLAHSGQQSPLARDHHEMADAIEAGDAEEADRLAREHTNLFHRRFLEFLGTTHAAEMDLGVDPVATREVILRR